MERLTKICTNTKNGKRLPYTVGNLIGISSDTTLGKVVERLAYYEDLEEQGKLAILSLDREERRDMEKEKYRKMCYACKYYDGVNPCEMKSCHIFRRLKQLEEIDRLK